MSESSTRKSLLFLPASIQSHIIPLFYLASLVAKEFDVWFAVADDSHEELVLKQGFNITKISPYKVCLGMERDFTAKETGNNGFFPTLFAIHKDYIYSYRRKEFDDLIQKINPKLILLDIFNSTDLLVLDSMLTEIPVIFVNPMLSTRSIPGLPTVDQGAWPNENYATQQSFRKKSSERLSVIDLLAKKVTRIFLDKQFQRLMSKHGFSDRHPLSKSSTCTKIFENIPEIILAPSEMEVSPAAKSIHQHYMGLCISENRVDIDMDPSFESVYSRIKTQKSFGKKIVYCSFGTFYEGSNRKLLGFLRRLIEAVRSISDVELVLSVNKLLCQTLRCEDNMPDSMHFLSKVPQLKMLQESDIFVTHGGLGSIKESIFFGVPMLVYPLDLRYDQNGNGLKVEYHRLGLRGNFLRESSTHMRAKINSILVDSALQARVQSFSTNCKSKYSEIYLLSILQSLSKLE